MNTKTTKAFKRNLKPGTVDGKPVFIAVEYSENGRLSFMGNWNGYNGQCRDELAAHEIKPAPGWDSTQYGILIEAWLNWHLNDMRAGCVHQRQAGIKEGQCSLCNYVYGSAWLKEEVPAPVIDFLQSLPDGGEYESPMALWVKARGITATVKRVPYSPALDGEEWGKDPAASHWAVKLKRGVWEMYTRCHQGSAHILPPTAAEVMACLVSDMASVESSRSFEEWASELGFDSDSRRAEKMYNAIKAQADKLRVFLGSDFAAALKIERE